MAEDAGKALEALSFEELAVLNERKEAIKKDHEAYVAAHPEIKTLLSSFMSTLLLEKPADVLAFAVEHFTAAQPLNAGVRAPSIRIHTRALLAGAWRPCAARNHPLLSRLTNLLLRCP